MKTKIEQEMKNEIDSKRVKVLAKLVKPADKPQDWKVKLMKATPSCQFLL